MNQLYWFEKAERVKNLILIGNTLKIFLFVNILIGCGSPDNSVYEDNDTIMVYEKPIAYVPDEVHDEPEPEPDPIVKYVSCYSWTSGRPVWGPKAATQMFRRGNYHYITLYPSGKKIKICAKCFGL